MGVVCLSGAEWRGELVVVDGGVVVVEECPGVVAAGEDGLDVLARKCLDVRVSRLVFQIRAQAPKNISHSLTKKSLQLPVLS